METELVKSVNRWGNSAGILLPREWLGQQVRITLIDRTLEIRKEVFRILEDYLDDIIGIYLVGSYARGEEDEESDIDILAITNETKKEIISGKYNLSLSSLGSFKKTILVQPELILPRVREAKTILNSKLLEELKIKPVKKLFKKFYGETKEIIKIAEGFIEMDRNKGEELVSHSAIYSLILRARGLYLIKTLIEDKKYKKKEFERWILKGLKKEEFEEMYQIYRLEKEEKSSKEIKVLIESGERLVYFLKKELEYLK